MVNQIQFAEVKVGDAISADYAITETVYRAFLEAYEDVSPLHVDEAFAKKKGFRGRVMHGGILNGFVSHLVGVRYPGEQAVLMSVDMRFHSPNYLGDRIRLEAQVSQKIESEQVIVLNIRCLNLESQEICARAKVQVKVGV